MAVVARSGLDLVLDPAAASQRTEETVSLKAQLEPLGAVEVEEQSARLAILDVEIRQADLVVERGPHQLHPAQGAGDPAELRGVTSHPGQGSRGGALAYRAVPCILRSMVGEQFAKRRLGDVVDGRYELKRLLGVGMTGAVYEAHHRYTHQRVAVKVMHQQLVSDDNAVARFLREAKSVAKIGHPAIVEVLDAGETPDGWPFVCLELLHGRSLGRVLAENGVLAP
ncbi:MAG TPA: hypothetical protein ENK57_09925, partial [Polyangiaceae bacterium]|nr:hypothetical protein [Polyangiaceae bacterium]